MATNLVVILLIAFPWFLCFQSNNDIGVSAQCNDYSVVGIRDGVDDSCMCDVQVSSIPTCTKPPSQSELDHLEDLQKRVEDISSHADLLMSAQNKTSEEMEITQGDLNDMTTKLERIESGDMKVNRPEFDLIIEEIQMLEQVLVLLEEERANNLQTVNQLETELALVEMELFDLKDTEDVVEHLLEQIDQQEEELAECKASIPPPGSGDDDLFVPWDDVGNQDSCADTFSVSSPYTVRTGTTNGVWMRDPVMDTDKILHFQYHTSCIYSSSYRNINSFPSYESYERERTSDSENYVLIYPNGPGLTAFNGSIYYTYYNSNYMYRYDVSKGINYYHRSLSGAGISGSSYEYTRQKCSAIDFAVDETGLWVIYATSSSVMKVSRLDPSTLSIIQTWTLNSVYKNSFGNCFIICAKLYCTSSSSGMISFKFDTVTGETSNQYIELLSRFGGLYTLDYNPRDQKLYGWDNGNMVLYDLKFANY